MKPLGSWVMPLVLFATGATAGQAGVDRSDDPMPVRLRPAMLAASIEQLAGQAVTVSGARAVGMFGSRALVIDTASRLAPAQEPRGRILVLVDDGEIYANPDLLVGSTVRVTGVARTIVGMQVTREVPWPAELDRARVARLDIQAAVLATSVQTPEGVELTHRLSGAARAPSSGGLSVLRGCNAGEPARGEPRTPRHTG
jgi:hypothetical protein